MSSNPTKSSLYPVLIDIRAYLQQLKLTLETEHEALANQDADKLNDITTAKQLLVENLEDLENERKAILRNAGMELNKTGVEAYLARFSQTSSNDIARLWEAISAISKQCEKQNAINGVIIESQRRRTENALAILQGKSTESDTYSNKGKSVAVSRKSTSIHA